MGELILVLGGARSGKSSFAERLARMRGAESVLYVATAEAHDAEMSERIAAHRRERPAGWTTLEAPREVGAALERAAGQWHVVLIDCLTLWASNELMLDESTFESHLAEDIEAVLRWRRTQDVDLIIVSNEVGLGLVPEYPLGRVFRDVLGRLNQRIALAADKVYWLVAGLPLQVKELAALDLLQPNGS